MAHLFTTTGEIEEGILYVDIDLEGIDLSKAAYDPVGHYSGPDALRLLVSREARARVHCSAATVIGDVRFGRR